MSENDMWDAATRSVDAAVSAMKSRDSTGRRIMGMRLEKGKKTNIRRGTSCRMIMIVIFANLKKYHLIRIIQYDTITLMWDVMSVFDSEGGDTSGGASDKMCGDYHA